MACKKRHKRENKRKNRNRSVFFVSLFVVLVTGGLAMLGYSAVLGRSDTEQQSPAERAPIVVDFFELEQNGQPAEDEAVEEQTTVSADDIADGADTPEQTVSAEEDLRTEDERLYDEALQKGEKVYLVNCADSERVTFAFAGDILLDDEYAMMFHYRTRGSDINDTFSANLLERMRSADVFMLNN